MAEEDLKLQRNEYSALQAELHSEREEMNHLLQKKTEDCADVQSQLESALKELEEKAVALSEQKDEAQQLQRLVDSLSRELQTNAQTSDEQLITLRKDIKEKEAALSNLEQTVSQMQNQNAALNKEVQKLQDSSDVLQNELKVRQHISI